MSSRFELIELCIMYFRLRFSFPLFLRLLFCFILLLVYIVSVDLFAPIPLQSRRYRVPRVFRVCSGALLR